MNIFFLWSVSEYVKNAQGLCDKHIVKMILEITQMLYAVQYRYNEEVPYIKGTKVPQPLIDALPEVEKRVKDKETGKMRRCIVKATPYKRTHSKHPMTLWVGDHVENYNHAVQLGIAMCEEYSMRYNKRTHACIHHLKVLKDFVPETLILCSKNRCAEDPPQCMPDQYKHSKDYVRAYRSYYVHEKMKTFVDKGMFKYKIPEHKPSFIKTSERLYLLSKVNASKKRKAT